MGAFGGFWLGHGMLLRTARIGLAAYARELMRNSDEMADELNSIFSQMNAPASAACSGQDIAGLRAQTFRYSHVKDIGRTHDGKLYCSAFLGRLAQPYLEGTPSLIVANQLKIYLDVPVLFASDGNGRATIVEDGDVNIVLNSTAFGIWDRAHITYMVVAIDRDAGRMTRIAGSPIEMDPPTVLVQTAQMMRGSIYRSVCSDRHPMCVVTTERVADVWDSTRSTQIAYSAMGGFAGLSLGLLIALFYQRTMSLSYQLVRAVRKDSPSLSLVYQPIIDIGTGRCMGAEALLRWTDQKGASISPDVFISLAEETGLINEVTALVVRRATWELSDLLRECGDFTLSINVAASDMAGERLFQLLNDHVVRAGICPRQIALELTERSTADLALVRAAIQRLCANGYKVHIDDFGVGFSSLSYIDQLRVDAIKIDRTFTRTIGTDAVIAPILSQMLDMARTLGVDVVVEGVETEFQRDFLAASGMSLKAQGWYFSRPLNAEILHSFNAQNKAAQDLLLSRREGNSLSLLQTSTSVDSACEARAADSPGEPCEWDSIAVSLAPATSLVSH
jgi:sensor c-di-GMP phosphodiesterase-like protein